MDVDKLDAVRIVLQKELAAENSRRTGPDGDRCLDRVTVFVAHVIEFDA